MSYNLENTEADKFNHLLRVLRDWSEDLEDQVVFITNDEQKVICNLKIFCVFSNLVRTIHMESRMDPAAFIQPVFISVPFSLASMTSLNELLVHGETKMPEDFSEVIEAANLFGVDVTNVEETVWYPESTSVINHFGMEVLEDIKQELDEDHIYPCSDCDKVFSRMDVLRKHYRRKHQSPLEDEKEVKIYNCDECDKSYFSQDHLTRHKKQHNAVDGNPFVCEMCNTTFSRKDALTRHKKNKNH